MTDLELAREWLHERPLVNEVSYVTTESLTALLARVRSDEAAKYPHPASIRLDEAKWWLYRFPTSTMVERDRIAALEQAAAALVAHDQKVRETVSDGWIQIRTSFYKELLAIVTAASKREED